MKTHLFFKFSILFFLAFVFLLVGAPTNKAQANKKYAAIVMDSDTGMILHQRHANKRLHPASLTKVMTLIMLFEAIERGDVKMNERIRISQRAAGMVPSKLGIPAGQSIRVKDAIYALIVKSANDVAVAVAEHLGGSEYNFAKMMTRRAKQLGMNKTHFRNASGLHHKYQVSTARDMAIMARYVINHYPDQYRYFSTRQFNYGGKTYKSHNRLLGSYKGMDGMKTGYINASGFNLIASAMQNNRRVIAVVFGGRTSKSRNAHMRTLLDRGFGELNQVYIARANAPVPDRKPVTQLARANVNTIAEQFAAIETASGAAKPQNFDEAMGQGDVDSDFSDRIQTGMLALAAHQNRAYTPKRKSRDVRAVPPAGVQRVSLGSAPTSKPETKSGDWAIQIGAYSTRLKTGHAIRKAMGILPSAFSHAEPIVSPYRRGNQYLYRARLSGYTKSQAVKACTYFKDCLYIAPPNKF